MSDIHEDIKAQLDLATEIMAITGLHIPAGQKHLEKCPFCEHKKCFSMMAKDGKAYKCHSQSCGVSGDIFTFYEEYLNITSSEALKKAADLAGIELKSPDPKKKSQETLHQRIFRESMEYYHSKALDGPGREYFIERRKHDEKLVKSMKLGFSDGHLKDHMLKEGYSVEDLVSAGLVREDSKDGKTYHRDFFAEGMAMFPHFDKKGFVIHFTQKDTDKKRGLGYQLTKAARSKSWMFYNQKALNSESVILVEGENDALTIMKAGYHNVMAMIGQVSDVQLKALQDNFKHKDVFLWFDKDDAGAGLDKTLKGKHFDLAEWKGKSYIEKVCRALKGAAYNVYIIEHPGDTKDADEYINAYEGDIKAECRRLIEHSIDYVKWQLKRIGELGEMTAIIEALKARKMFSTIATMPRLERKPYIELLKTLGLDDDDIKEQMEVNKELREAIGVIAANAGTILKADPYKLTRVIYEHFEANGKFFKDKEHNVYLLYNNIIYEISSNRPFNALMDKSGGLLCNRAPGAQVWEALANKGYNNGTTINISSWLQTDLIRDAIYINLNASDNTILRIDKDAIREVPNGLNEDDVLLKASSKIQKMEFNGAQDVREGLKMLKNLVLDNMTCEREQGYFIICWFISAFLLDFMPYMALMKFSGASSSGKTTTAKFLSILTYGQEVLGHVSSAAAYSSASQNPLVILDNLEEADRNKSLKMFLLLCATGGSKEKRAGGTDSETIQEKPRSLVLITAIEPLEEPELINRTIDINFSKRHKKDGFIESEALRGLVKHRDSIISAILKLIQRDILPNFSDDLKANLAILKKEYKGHSKDRADEYIALMMIILERIIPHMPFAGEGDHVAPKDSAAEIWREWITYQNRQAEEDEATSNSILRMLDGLAAEFTYQMRSMECKEESEEHPLKDMKGPDGDAVTVARYTHPIYLLTAEKTAPRTVDTGSDGQPCEQYTQSYLVITAKSIDIVNALSKWCSEKSLKNPHSKAGGFTKRLSNDRATLAKGGWEIVVDPRLGGPYSKIIKGTRFITLVKELVR
jgi:DNA primase